MKIINTFVANKFFLYIKFFFYFFKRIMAKLSFEAELQNGEGGKIKAGLELYVFAEESMFIIYCPALDLSAYGKTEEEAKKEFAIVFEMYINYSMNKKTLVKDLQNHGWKVKSSRQKKMKAPTTKEMLNFNSTLRDIIYNKDYKKVSECVEFPQLA